MPGGLFSFRGRTPKPDSASLAGKQRLIAGKFDELKA